MIEFLASTRSVRGCFAALLVTWVSFGLPMPLSAATVTVPTDHATIQDAVNAVQGTAGALVIVDSDATFDETVTVTDSVTIEAGPGRTPTIRGDATENETIFFNPPGTSATSLELRDLRLLPEPGGNSSVDVVDILKDGTEDASVLLDRVIVDDPESTGASAVNVRVGFAASGNNLVTLQDCDFTLGGTAGFSTTGITMLEQGTLTVTNLTLTMTDGDAEGFDIRGSVGSGITFSLDDSVFSLSAPDGPFSSEIGRLLGDVDATFARNTFHLIDATQGSVNGIVTSPGSPTEGAVTLRLDSNRIVGPGTSGAVVSASPFAGGSVDLTAVNNVVTGVRTAFSFNPQSAEPGAPIPTVDAVIVNNTIDGSTNSAIRFGAQDGAVVNASVFNNLLTNSGEWGIGIFDNPAATFNVTNDFNGYAGNGLGNVEPPLVVGGNALFADPLYVDRAGGDLHLVAASPAIDVGDNGAPSLPALDADGETRVQGGIVDLGAFEGGELVGLAIPTLDGVGLGLLVALLGLAGFAALRRRGTAPRR